MPTDLFLESAISTAENQYPELPRDLLRKLVKQESGGNPQAVSPKGAQGLFQFMPATAKELGINPADPHQAADGAARYLLQNYKEFGDWDKALAAYNAGPGAVRKYGGVPPFPETQNYVRNLSVGQQQASEPVDLFEAAGLNRQSQQRQPRQDAPMSAVPDSLGGRIGASAGSALTDLWLGAKQRANDLMINERGKPGGDEDECGPNGGEGQVGERRRSRSAIPRALRRPSGSHVESAQDEKVGGHHHGQGVTPSDAPTSRRQATRLRRLFSLPLELVRIPVAASVVAANTFY
jgi:hypothetical protein